MWWVVYAYVLIQMNRKNEKTRRCGEKLQFKHKCIDYSSPQFSLSLSSIHQRLYHCYFCCCFNSSRVLLLFECHRSCISSYRIVYSYNMCIDVIIAMAFIYCERHWTWKLNKNFKSDNSSSNGSSGSDSQTKNINQHSCFAAHTNTARTQIYAYTQQPIRRKLIGFCTYVCLWLYSKCDKSNNYLNYLRFNGNLKQYTYMNHHQLKQIKMPM